MIALPSDVSRGNAAVKGCLPAGARDDGRRLCRQPRAIGRPQRQRALALVSMAVGAMVLSRSVGDESLAKELRQSARNEAYAQPGWGLASRRRKPRNSLKRRAPERSITSSIGRLKAAFCLPRPATSSP